MTPEEFLLAHGADRIDHPGGTLYDHLIRVAATLAEWGAGDEVRLAGLCHATYGTDGFDQTLLPIEDRPALRDVIGEAAEALVYLYAACDRRAVYPRLDGSPAAEFLDRFTGTADTVAGPMLRGFMEMTAANELDVLARQPVMLAQYGPSLLKLFSRCRELLSPPAWDACERLLTPAA
jgi:Domain of unknown function (DUF6817)